MDSNLHGVQNFWFVCANADFFMSLGSIHRLDEELKPRSCLVLEEDEGFSDWSHRLETCNEKEVQADSRAGPSAPPDPEEELQRGRRAQRASRGAPQKVEQVMHPVS